MIYNIDQLYELRNDGKLSDIELLVLRNRGEISGLSFDLLKRLPILSDEVKEEA